ncbi:MAG: 16S rRNA (guanine(527)-N(7))-methyltransferase RsmG [Thermodesulfobacteriota bacterium]
MNGEETIGLPVFPLFFGGSHFLQDVLRFFKMENENRTILIEGSKVFGILLDEKAVKAFEVYLKELLKWNQKINLTAIRSEKGMVLKHFLDSLSVFPHLSQASSLLDIGSGAGFPGIPLKIVEPSLEVTLIDSVLKKVDFQRHIIRILGLKGIRAIHGRVQDREARQTLGERFDRVVSRAFSDLPTFLCLSFPFLKRGGMALAMKGQGSNGDTQSLSETEKTPYRLQKAVSFSLPFSSSRRSILLFEKI